MSLEDFDRVADGVDRRNISPDGLVETTNPVMGYNRVIGNLKTRRSIGENRVQRQSHRVARGTLR